jgi:hypothetical protein
VRVIRGTVLTRFVRSVAGQMMMTAQFAAVLIRYYPRVNARVVRVGVETTANSTLALAPSDAFLVIIQGLARHVSQVLH